MSKPALRLVSSIPMAVKKSHPRSMVIKKAALDEHVRRRRNRIFAARVVGVCAAAVLLGAVLAIAWPR